MKLSLVLFFAVSNEKERAFSRLQTAYTPEIGTLSVCDIINRSLQSLSSDICYVSPVLTTLKTVRYMKHTCTLTKLHILASNQKSELRQILV